MRAGSTEVRAAPVLLPIFAIEGALFVIRGVQFLLEVYQPSRSGCLLRGGRYA